MTLDDVMKKNYETLMSYPNKEDYYRIFDLGCGMVRYRTFDRFGKELIIVDEEAKRAYPIVSDRYVWDLYGKEDVVPECRGMVGVKDGHLYVLYDMTVERFEDGVAEIVWLTGGDREERVQEYLYAKIDRKCRLITPFSTEKYVIRPIPIYYPGDLQDPNKT